jgi:serine/threonine-protein kinase RsbW
MDVRSGADVIELTLPARVEYIGVVRLLISGIANRIGLSYDEIEDMKLAVAEACTNASLHAYKDDDQGSIHIRCTIYEDRIVIVVADSGTSFDMANLKEKRGPIDKNVDIEDLTEGGLGLYLIHTLMDEVEISEEAGVVVSMTKYLRRDEVAGDVDAFSQSQTE